MSCGELTGDLKPTGENLTKYVGFVHACVQEAKKTNSSI